MTTIPVIISTEVTCVRIDDFDEEVVLSVEVTGAVWEDEDGVPQVMLRSAHDDRQDAFVGSVDDMSWSERTWAEDGLIGTWEDLNERAP